jgi:ParB-like chromosome segregation protein Spo0J
MDKHTPWRERVKVHPFADTFPMLTGPARAGLREDIRKHGVREPIVLWLDNREIAASGNTDASPDEGELYLVDGRNRLAIAMELGLEPELQVRWTEAYRLRSGFGGKQSTRWVAKDPDPEALIMSLNVHRRHLTAAQKQKAIKAYATLSPNASNRKIARTIGVSDKTVAKTRNGAPNAEIPQKTQPRERVKQAVLANPSLSNRELAKAADVSEATVRRARMELDQPSQPKRPKPAPKLQPVRDPVISRLNRELTKLAEEQVENLAHIDASEVSIKTMNAYAVKVDETHAALQAHIKRLTTKGKKLS